MDLTRIKRILQVKLSWPDLVKENEDQKATEVSVFPLPNVVLLPGSILPLHIFEERYKKMTGEILAKGDHLAMSCLTPNAEGGLAPAKICGVGKVTLLEEFSDGRRNICVTGERRCRILAFTQREPYLKAHVEWIPDADFANKQAETEALATLKQALTRWIFLNPRLPDHFVQYVGVFARAHHLTDFVGYYLTSDTELKQRLLEMSSRPGRFEIVRDFLHQDAQSLENDMLKTGCPWRPELLH